MRLNQLILKDVGPFKDISIPFEKGIDPTKADVYLITGPNGAGKSTILYVIAGLISSGHIRLGSDLGSLRYKSKESTSIAMFDEGYRGSKWKSGNDLETIIFHTKSGILPLHNDTSHGHIRYFRSDKLKSRDTYYNLAGNFNISTPHDVQNKFSWAAFAYAGMRSIVDTKITSIKEPTESPFTNSLSFNQTADASQLANWIANQEYKRLKAKEFGRMDKATELKNSISIIEEIISDIIEESFCFETSIDDNNIRAKKNGVVVELGLLPDGLKSIVSWIADLLMRLDRIPWVNDTPVLERSFLLLLDEVDIHLHPAWQRKVLPIVQKMFPNAQIIASTHSPFVVSSVDDAQIIALTLKDNESVVSEIVTSQTGVSYSVLLKSIFGINSEFDIETEQLFKDFYEVKKSLLSGSESDKEKLIRIANLLGARSEETKELVAIELRQFERNFKAK